MRLLRPTLVVAAIALPASAGAEPLSRAEAVAAALRANPDVRRSLEDLRRLDGIITEAKADALPELTLTGTATRFRDPSLLNTPNFDAFPEELRAGFLPITTNLYEGLGQLRQTLFSFKVGKAIRAARFGRSFGQEERRRAEQTVALAAVHAYNAYLLSLEQVRVAERSLDQKRQHLDMAKNRRTAGVATDLDVLRSEVDFQNRRSEVLRARGAAELARGRLNAVMVQPIDAPVEPTDRLEYVPVDVTLDEAVREAWAERPESKAVALAEKIRGELVGIARAESRPSLELHANWGYSVRRASSFFDGDYVKWAAVVSLKVPVFDGFRTAGKVAQAKAEQGKVAQDRIALENQIRLEAKDAVDRLNVARSILEAAELNVTQARKALDMTQANYNYGAATTLDVLDAQNALTVAEINRIEALHTHADARATLRYVMARDPLDPQEETGTMR